ncbi:MAG: hybrid sensor histidine kinase/response regulator [Rhodocyclales bacterium GT-UBC]|nr:MAG: hybrid sensor histidine kinase/response regulator [Rhodocyclales bacterium GT-UBC]
MTVASPEPRDLGQEAGSILAFGALMFMVSCLFVFSRPWWQPLFWAGVYNMLLWWRWRYLQRVERQARQGLVSAKRTSHWICAAWAGSAGYWLFVPDDPMMHGALTFGMLCVITSIVLECVGDALRVGVALFLVMAPTAIRFLFQSHPISITLGVGAFVAGPVWWELWRRQQRIWSEQYQLRQRAEQGAQALAESTLSKARFFAAANHDLRQPVHALGLYLELLDRQALDAEGRAALSGMQRAWTSLSSQLNQLLDLARADAGALRPALEVIPLADFLENQVAHHAVPAMAKGQRMIACGGEARAILADRLMLGRVVDNLVGNAIKFSPEGATITLLVRYGQAGTWRLQVRDNGPGIASAERELIFEEFVQGGNAERDRQAGFGLGLSIARRFVEAMGGELTLVSPAGAGSTFEVRLPRANPSPVRRAEALPVLPAGGRQRLSVAPAGRRLLLIDDDPMVVEAMHAWCRAWGLAFLSTADGRDALRLAEPVDVVVCDVRLPNGQNGIEIAHAFRDQGRPVILISGEIDASIRTRAEQLQLTLLIKPVAADTLRDCLDSLLGA